MKIEQVKIKCTDNGREMLANFVSKTDTTLVAYWPQADMKLVMNWNGRVFVASKTGYEFTSDGKIV